MTESYATYIWVGADIQTASSSPVSRRARIPPVTNLLSRVCGNCIQTKAIRETAVRSVFSVDSRTVKWNGAISSTAHARNPIRVFAVLVSEIAGSYAGPIWIVAGDGG
jgi:hypothetical protein